MNRPFILDASGVRELFAGHPRLLTLFRWANRGQALIVVPATALVHASREVGITEQAWESVLYAVTVTPLDQSAAFGVLDAPERIDIAHVAWEATRIAGTVVTRHPAPYRLRKLAVLAIGR